MPSTSRLPWWAAWSLAAAVVAGFLAACFRFHNDTLLTALITIATAVVSYYFGSSSDSSKKTDIIAAGSPPPTAAPGPPISAELSSAVETLRSSVGAPT